MFVVQIDGDDARKFRAFQTIREARIYARRFSLVNGSDETATIFEVSDTDDAEIAVMAVRDGLGLPVIEPEPDAAVLLASMGLGTGLRL